MVATINLSMDQPSAFQVLNMFGYCVERHRVWRRKFDDSSLASGYRVQDCPPNRIGEGAKYKIELLRLLRMH